MASLSSQQTMLLIGAATLTIALGSTYLYYQRQEAQANKAQKFDTAWLVVEVEPVGPVFNEGDDQTCRENLMELYENSDFAYKAQVAEFRRLYRKWSTMMNKLEKYGTKLVGNPKFEEFTKRCSKGDCQISGGNLPDAEWSDEVAAVWRYGN